MQMTRPCLLSLSLALALLCPAAAQLPDAPAPQQPAASSDPQPQGDAKAGNSEKKKEDKKGNPLVRVLKRAAPDCVNVGSSYCRDDSDNNDDAAPQKPQNQAPPRSDHETAGSSSSHDTQIDLSPPANDLEHPGSPLSDDVTEFHPWDPHKAAKDIEVGDFYFKRGNWRAAESRYREALQWKPRDAEATFRLAESLDRQERAGEALETYESYLKILPNGEYAKQAHEAISRLKQAAPQASR